MSATIDKAMIINWALTEIGAGPMFSTSDQTDLAQNIENTWQRTVEFAFGLDDWNWAQRTVRLVRQADVPENGWRYGFDLPADRVGSALAFLDQAGHSPRALRNFHLEGKTVFVNVPDLWAEIRIIVAVDDWEVGFRAAFTKLLASELAIPVFQDKALKEDLRTICLGQPHEKNTGGLFGRLMGQNKAAEPMGASPLMATTPLDDARYSSGPGYQDWAGKFG